MRHSPEPYVGGAQRRINGRLTEISDKLSARLNENRLADECDAYQEITDVGLAGRRMLMDRSAYPRPLLVTGDEEKFDEAIGGWCVPVRSLQARATVALETGRFVILKELPNGPMMLRVLEDPASLPSVGPARDLTLAAASRYRDLGRRTPRDSRPVGEPAFAPSWVGEVARAEGDGRHIDSLGSARDP